MLEREFINLQKITVQIPTLLTDDGRAYRLGMKLDLELDTLPPVDKEAVREALTTLYGEIMSYFE